MKKLIVLRHAKSNWEAHYDGDMNRPITTKAEKHAKATGELIRNKSIELDFAIISSALRTQQTFKAFQTGYDKAINHKIKNEIYHGDLKKILSLLQKTSDTYKTILMVGHEPTCSFFTEQLLKKVNQEIIFKTATIAKIDFEIESWADINWLSGSLDWLKRAK